MRSRSALHKYCGWEVIGIANSFQHSHRIVLVFNMRFFMMSYQDLKELSRSIIWTVNQLEVLYQNHQWKRRYERAIVPTCNKTTNCLNAKMVLPYKRLQTVHECLNRIKAQRALAWLAQALQQYICLIFWKLNKNFQNKASGHGVIFSYDSNKNIFLIDCLQSHIKIAPCHWGLRIVGWKTEHLDDGMKLYEWFNDCTITGYQIIIFEETGMIKFENQNLSRVSVLR